MPIPTAGFPLAAAVSPRLQVAEHTDSTNADLVAAVRDAPRDWPHLSALLTTDQRRGRGRLDRTWVAPPGAALALSVVVETGGRFVLDPRNKHEPTLVSPEDGDRRVDFYRRAVDICVRLGSPVLHLWSGVDRAGDADAAWGRLTDGLGSVLDAAARQASSSGWSPNPAWSWTPSQRGSGCWTSCPTRRWR